MNLVNAEIVKKLKSHFPPERIINCENELASTVENSTLTSHFLLLKIVAINKAEIITLLSIANEYKTPVYPISNGHNWGYGSRSPYTDGCILLDLSSMNKILDFNEQSGVMTIEPGVTQNDVFQYLQKKNAPFLTPTTGAGPNVSVLANALEHGFGLTPETDHCQSIMGLEAILPDGSLYRSDFTEKGARDLDKHFKWGIGPYLDGIFTQSNFGIVTSMSIALSFRPSDVSAFYFTLRSEENIEKVVEAIQKIMHKFKGSVGGINLMNDLRVISMLQSSPSTKSLSDDEVRCLREELTVSKWSGVGTLYCEKEIAHKLKKEIKKYLKNDCSQFVFINRAKLKKINLIIGWLPRFLTARISQRIKKINESLDIFEGKPGPAALPLSYWKSKHKMPINRNEINPDQFDLGLIWYSPIVLMDPEKVNEVCHFVKKTCQKHNIDPLITFSAFNPRVFDATIPILFNKKDPTQSANAHSCYEELVREGQKIQCLPYRLGVLGSKLSIENNKFWALQKKIKSAIDPNNILAPGRYSLEESKINQRLYKI